MHIVQTINSEADTSFHMDGTQPRAERCRYQINVIVFRGRRGDLSKVLWFSGHGTNLYIKRLERGRLIWPNTKEGTALLSAAQFSMLCEAIVWRAPDRTWWPKINSV